MQLLPLLLMLFSGILASVSPAASAQVPDPQQEMDNITGRRSEFFAAELTVLSPTFVDLAWLEQRATVDFSVRDISNQAMAIQSGGIVVDCELTALTETGNWMAQLDAPCSGTIQAGGQRQFTVQVTRSLVAGPISASWRMNVTMAAPIQEFVGSFDITTRVEDFPNVAITTGVPPIVRPDEQFDVPVTLKNTGNAIGVYRGVLGVPDGWEAAMPEYVTVLPGQEETFNISVIAPREKMLYLSESGLISLTFTEVYSPQIVRSANVPVLVNGFYLMPQLIPFVLIAFAILVMFVVLAVMARRAIEEQILGKPVPPWRIPVEMTYLRDLMRTDPDQYYIVRYYLMVEEHNSALLWFAAYKKATKKDRKAESAWFTVKKKQERKITGQEKAHARVGRKGERLIAISERKRERKVRRLEKKLRRIERKKQRKFDRRHDKTVAKQTKKHGKRLRKATRRHEKRLTKAQNTVFKQNRRREKRGEDLLPPPDLPAPDLPAPELQDRRQAESVALEESRFGKRVERINRRFDRRRERLTAQGAKRVHKDRAHRDAKIEKLRAKIPPEPTTDLYEADQFVGPDEVIVEDDRSRLARLLHIPTLQERDAIRRRSDVYRAKIREARASGDDGRIEGLKAARKQAIAEIHEGQSASFAAARASRIEQRRLAKEEKRRVKARARELVQEAAGETDAFSEGEREPPGDRAPVKNRPGFPVARRRRPEQAEAGSATVEEEHEA